MGLGPVQTISLSEARKAALNCRKRLHDGVDPIEARIRKREIQRKQVATANGSRIRSSNKFDAYAETSFNTTNL